MMVTVHELRKMGYKVQIRHNRCFGYAEATGKPVVLSKGGSTEVLVTYPTESNVGSMSVVGVAECSPKDNYDRKLGVRIALGRALKHTGFSTK